MSCLSTQARVLSVLMIASTFHSSGVVVCGSRIFSKLAQNGHGCENLEQSGERARARASK